MSTTSESSTPHGAGRVIQRLSRALFLWVIPALLAALVVRHLLPSVGDPFDPLSRERVAKLAQDSSAAIWATFFLFFALLARYWENVVPGLQTGAPLAEGHTRLDRRALSFVLLIAITAGVALLLRASVFQSYRVLSSSMLPGLTPGAHLAINKLAYGLGLPGFERVTQAPRRGDVIVFRNPESSEGSEEVVKRVIGLPGDTIGAMNGHPVINDWVVPACLAGRYPVVGGGGPWIARLIVEFLEDTTYLVLFPESGQVAAPFAGYRVKPGEVFVLGDNRATSVDSRAWNKGRGGGLPLASISGRVDRILLGADRNGHANLSQLLEPLALDLNLYGVDAHKLEKNVQGCLKLRPASTKPPPPGESRVSK